MSGPRYFLTVAGVALLHILALLSLAFFKIPHPKPKPVDAFTWSTSPSVDPETGEAVTLREFTVSTKLHPRDELPPPAAEQ